MSAPFLLLPYQARWVADDARVQVGEKSRRIGITWASAIRAVLESAAADGWDTYYVGYRFELAEEFIREAADFARAIHGELAKVETFIFEDQTADGEPRGILAYQLRFASGFRIVALSSSPRNLRGIQGRIIIDEAAFHDSLPELMKAAMATLMWGGRVSIISTHNGEDNPFNKLIQDILAGRFSYSHHRVTLDDALAEGLYQRIALVTGQDPSVEAQQRFRDELIQHYGDGADEELFCIPKRSGGVYISPALVEACMLPTFKVLRLKLDDAFVLANEADQRAEIQPWIDTQLLPAIAAAIDKARPSYLGEDFGRRSDITVIAIAQEAQDLTLNYPLIVELRNVPFDVQKLIFQTVADAVSVGRMALDSSGNGMSLGEAMAISYGNELVHRVGISVKLDDTHTRSLSWPKWYAENLPRLKARFEDGTIRVPRDYDIRNDLTTFHVVNGIPALPKLRQQSKAPDSAGSDYRHGDAAVAIALAEYAARVGAVTIKASAAGKRRSPFHDADRGPNEHNKPDTDRAKPRGFRRAGML